MIIHPFVAVPTPKKKIKLTFELLTKDLWKSLPLFLRIFAVVVEKRNMPVVTVFRCVSVESRDLTNSLRAHNQGKPRWRIEHLGFTQRAQFLYQDVCFAFPSLLRDAAINLKRDYKKIKIFQIYIRYIVGNDVSMPSNFVVIWLMPETF